VPEPGHAGARPPLDMRLEHTGYEVTPWARVRQEDFGLLFYDTGSTDLTYVRSGGALTVSRSEDGSTFLFRSRSGVCGDSLSRALAALVDKGLTQRCSDGERATPTSAGEVLASRPERARGRSTGASGEISLHAEPLRAPVNVTWEITSRCNLKCRHCLSAEIRNGHGDVDSRENARTTGYGDLTYEECLSFIDQVAALGVFQLNLGGGEPFLREGLLDILRYAQGRGLVTCVSTNGLLLSNELVRELVAMDLLYLQVSLDGATPETNDAIRGPGVFARAVRGMELLSRQGMRGWSINTVVTRTNLPEVSELRALADRLGAKTRLSRFRPAGNAKQVWEEYRLNPEGLVALSFYLDGHREVLTGDSFFALAGKERRQLGLNTCGAARMTLSVSPTGDVYPCAFLCEPEFLAGNVRQASLVDIFRCSPVLRGFRRLDVEACQSCERFELCHGGCPAVAYFTDRSLAQPDPECLVSAMDAWTDVEAG